MKKNIATILIFLFVFWIGKIYNINQTRKVVTFYDIGDTADCGDLDLYFVESHLDEQDDFNKRFGIDYSVTGEHKMISVCIEVTNKSKGNIEWAEVIDFLECGFESQVWASAIDTTVSPMINIFNTDCLKPGMSQKIWFAAEINKACFRNESWKHIDEYQYLYVLSLTPHKTAVRLKV